MKKIAYSLIFAVIMIMPTIVKAECSVEEKVRLRKIASNIAFTYDYKLIPTTAVYYKATFSVTISNLHPDLYLYDMSTGKRIDYNSSKELILNDYKAGTSIEFQIFSNYGNCKNEMLQMNYVALPFYNQYFTDPLCRGLESYKLCGRWNRIQLSYSAFEEEMLAYKESLKPKEEEEENKPKDNISDHIIDFLTKYSIYIFGGIALIAGAWMIYLNRKDDFDLKIK